MYDTAVKFGEGLYNLFGSNEATRATACIHGTVARVADNCTLVIYGGKFTGYDSTPNVRNAVIEVSYNRSSNGIQTSSDPRYGRTQGGAVYVFDGTFTAMAGANVFNMYITNRNEDLTTTVWTVKEDENGNRVVSSETVPLMPSETFGLELVTYEKVTYNGVTQDMPVDTGNIMIRGGTFRCYFEPTMMATLNPDTRGTDKSDGKYCPEHDKYDDDCDDVDHNKFSGTVGTVNLGVQSFDEDMIRDGRIQLVDVYGSGRLVLLDGGDPIDPDPEDDSGKTEEEILAEEQKAWDEFLANGGDPSSKAPDNTYTTNITKAGGIRKYRLFISDVELRALEYLTVHPNTAITNSTESFALQTYYGTPTDRNPRIAQPWVTDDENIRAPYSSNEGYFEFEFDDPGYSEGIFISPDLKLNGALLAGDDLAKSPVWYYTIPVNAAGESLGDFSYTDTFLRTKYDNGSVVEASFNRTREEHNDAYSAEFWWGLEDFIESNTQYFKRTDAKYSTNIKFFVYKIYRVDPLSRESINESDEWSANEPLLELRYGANNDSVKCIVTLKELEKAIEKRLREKGEIGQNESWSYRSGDLFRIVFSVEERLGYGYSGSQDNGEVKFLNELAPATAEASILIRCVSKNEDKDSYHYNPSQGTISAAQVADWTPLQFVSKDKSTGRYVKNENLVAGDYATVELINGQTGMVDWQGARIFDIYYQWYILDDPEDTTPTLIAGTDNVWIAQDPYGSKQFHKPDNFLLKEDGSYLGVNGEHYANTVDPASPEVSMYTYGPNGLPVNTEDVKHSPDLWTNEMLHMYTYETANSEDGMKKFSAADIAAGRAPEGTKDRIYLANNNTFWGNTDSVYIPTEYAGKYLMCKMVAVNVRYPYLYDNLQTIYSHAVKIDGPSLPEFDTITPGVTAAELEKGTKNLGTFLESPTFAFTYTDLEQKYINAGYKIEPTINVRNVASGENFDATTTKEGCAEGYQVRKDLGRYAVELRLTLLSPDGTEMEHRKMTFNMTLGFTPAFTSMTPAPSADDLAAGITDLGKLDEPVTFSFTYDDTPLPQWLTEKGYQRSAYMAIYQDGKLLGTVPAGEEWTPSAGGERMVVFVIELYSYAEGKTVTSVSHTYKFSMDAAETGALSNLTAGQTDLGTVTNPSSYFVELYPENIPQWMQDQGYYLASKMEVVVDGVCVFRDINQGKTYTPDQVGSYHITREAQLYNNEGAVVERITEITTFTVPQQNITSIEFLNEDCTVPVNMAIVPEYEAMPANFHKTPTLTLSTSNSTVVKVDGSRFVAAKDGTATLTITCSETSTSHSFDVTVYTPHDVYVGGIGLDYGEYLAQGSDTPTTTQPADNYVYFYKDGNRSTLVMHNFSYYGKNHGVYAKNALTIELEGENTLDMALSSIETSTYTYYGASGIVSPGFVINGGEDDYLTILNYYVGIDNQRSYNDVEFNGGNLIIREVDVGTAISISNSDVYLYGTNITSYDGFYFGSNYVELTDGEIYINTPNGTAWDGFKVYMQFDGGKVTAISDENYGFYLDSSSTWNMNGGSVYAEGPWHGLGASSLDLTVSGGQMLFISSTEIDDGKGPEDRIQGALGFDDSITFGTGCYAYGSMERDGRSGEAFDVAKQQDYDFVFFGTDPRVFSVNVYTNADCTALWDGSYALNQYDNLQIIHKHVLEYHEEIPATCTASGTCAYWHCTDCQKLYSDEACTTQITDSTIAALDHNWIWYDCVNPNTCSRCGLTDDNYPPTGHSWGAATCEYPSKCFSCGETRGGLLDHNWVEADCVMGKHCDMCYMEISDPLGHILEGEIIIPEWAKVTCSWGSQAQQWCARCEDYVWIDLPADPNAHSWVGGDCENPAQCEYCEAYSSNVAGHNWSEATCTTPATCSRCNITDGTAPGHVWEDATCAHPKLCINCGTTEGSALAHTWKDATCTDPKTCTVCWATEGSKTAHSYENGTCTVCGESNPDYVPPVTATITQKGRNLEYKDMIYVIDIFELTGVEGIDLTTDAGILVWSQEEYAALNGNIVYDEAHAKPGLESYPARPEFYFGKSDGIFTRDLYKTAWYAGYVKLPDGTYVYSEAKEYGPETYAYKMLTSGSEKTKTLCVALLNYISAAQKYFDPSTPDSELVNYELTAEQKALTWDNPELNLAATEIPAGKDVTRDKTVFKGRGKNLLFEEMISLVSVYVIDTATVTKAQECGTIFWTAEQFEALTETPSVENYGEGTKITGFNVYQSTDGQWYSAAPAVAPKDMAETEYYILGYLIDADGEVHYSGVMSYTFEQYIANMATNANMGEFAKRLYYYERAVKDALA